MKQLTNLTNDVLFFHIFSRLGVNPSFSTLSLVNKKIQQVIDTNRSRLFFYSPSTSQVSDDDKVRPFNLLRRCSNITKLGLNLETLHDTGILSDLFLSLKTNWPEKLVSLELQIYQLEPEEGILEQISYPQLLKLKCILHEAISVNDAESQLNLLLEGNQNLTSLHLDSLSGQKIDIPFHVCKSFKKIKYTGCLPITPKSIENLQKCTNLQNLSLQEFTFDAISSFESFLFSKRCRQLTHLHLDSMDLTIPIETNNLTNLQFFSALNNSCLSENELQELGTHCKKLKSAILEIKDISEEALNRFIQSQPNLEELTLRKCDIFYKKISFLRP